MKSRLNQRKIFLVGSLSIGAFMFAQNTETDTVKTASIDDVVVTGNANPKASIKTSISISTLKPKDIEQAAPRTTAEIFRTIPGIRAESSGGEGNSNITVRGVPVSAGGSRYLLIQEDGLPVLQFGDMAFATQDQFTRFDSFVSRIEAVRGGSASVFASNSPAGIINFITNTGEKRGGSISQELGVDYRNYRTDFNYGTPINDDTFVSVGGFFRAGDGARKTGFNSNVGGQFRMSFMKNFENGYFRVYTKLLDDRTAAYMPMPIGVTGTNEDPVYKSLPNYDALTGAMQTINLQKDRAIGSDGNILESDLSDGMRSLSKSIGAEFSYNFDGGWKIDNKIRYSANSGQFLAPFPATVGTFAEVLGAPYSSATYAGTNTAIDQNAIYMRMHLFNTKLNDFNNFTNNFNLSKKFGGVKANVGLYKALQNVNMSWQWNTYLQEVNGYNARLVDVRNPAGNLLTTNGLLAYGTPAWGNLNRNYDTKYDITAPFAQIEFKATENISIDGGVRYDLGKVSGSFAGGSGSITKDMNQDGTISLNEQNVYALGSSITPVKYEYDIFSWTLGANYAINSKNALFIRGSQGGSAAADRILFSSYNYTNSSDPGLEAVKVNKVTQVEGGYKLRSTNFFVNTTLFYAGTEESNYEATTQIETKNKYRSFGLELDGFYKLNDYIDFKGGFTYTNAKITNAKDETTIDNTPRRTPQFMYSFNPNVNYNKFSAGFYLVGVTKSYSQDNNKLVMNGYTVVNPYLSYRLTSNINLSLNGNNVFDALGITEAEEGSIPANNIVRARPIQGRSISMSIKLDL